MSNQNPNNLKYGLAAGHVAVALSGTVFLCLAVGTILIGATGYGAEAFKLSSTWTIGFGALTWFFVLVCP